MCQKSPERRKVADTLTATVVDRNGEDVSDNVTFQWYADDVAIEGATDETLGVTVAMIGSTIKVVATAESGNTFESEETAAVTEPTIDLVAAKMLSADSIEVTFDQDASDYVAQEDLEVALADDTLVLPIKTLEFAEDGESAVITLTTALKDGADYKVSLGDSYVEFTASVGEVASIVILTDSAQVGVKTPIEFALYDENGVDVTGAYKSKIDTTCQIKLDTSATYDNDRASKTTITFDKEGDTADVTITYNSNKAGAEDVVAEGTITCIAAEATVGTKQYVQTSKAADINKKSKSAKFYKGIAQTTSVSVEEGATDDSIYFCAIDENGDAISYDTYAVESSNDDIMSASVTVDTGKYAKISVAGSQEGEAVINVTATKNGAETPYTIPVKITKVGVLSKITVAVDKDTISNAVDTDYKFGVTVKAYDTNGKEISNSDNHLQVNILTDDPDGKEADKVVSGLATLYPGKALGFVTEALTEQQIKDMKATYHAWGATEGTRYIKVEVSEGDVVVTKRVQISVKALNEKLWNDNTDAVPANATYRVELQRTKIDEGSDKTTSTARLAAYIGDRFAGYVRQGGAVTIGDVPTGGAQKAAANAVYKLDGSHKVVTFTGDKTATEKGLGNGYSFELDKTGTPATQAVYKVTLSGTAAADTAGDITIANVADAAVTVTPANGDTADTVVGKILTAMTGAAGAKYTASKETAADGGTTLILTAKPENAGVVEDAPTITLATTITGLDATEMTNTTVGKASTIGVKLVNKKFTITVAANAWDATDIKAAWDAALDVDASTDGAQAATTFFTAAATDDNAGSYTTYAQTTIGGDADKSAVLATESTRLTNIKSGVNFGAKYSNDGKLYNGTDNVAITKDAITDAGNIHDFTISTVTTTGANATLLSSVVPGDGVAVTKFLVSGDPTKDGSFARTGNYTMLYTATMNGKSIDFKSSFTVVNLLYNPKVYVLDRVVDTLTAADVKAVLKASVDLNNNESDHESIGSALIKEVDASGVITEAQADSSGTKITVKYVPVVEDDVVFLVPINTTFKTE